MGNPFFKPEIDRDAALWVYSSAKPVQIVCQRIDNKEMYKCILLR